VEAKPRVQIGRIRLGNKKTVRDRVDELHSTTPPAASQFGTNDRLEVRTTKRPLQKTALICPCCYRDGDIVIWGVHKNA
jgi:hypothetical protein